MEHDLESIFVKGPISKNKLPNEMKMVMLHGWGQSVEFFESFAILLSSKLNISIYLIDLPGFGKSAAPSMVWDSKEYARVIIAKIQALGLSKILLWGHSFGGKVALCISYQQPDLVEKLIIMSASGLLRKKTFIQDIRSKSIKRLGKILKKVDSFTPFNPWEQWFVPKYGSADYKNAQGIMKKILVKTVQEDLSELAHSIKVATTIVWGENDKETPIEMGQRYHKLIKGSHLISVPYLGHMTFENLSYHLVFHLISPTLTSQGQQ